MFSCPSCTRAVNVYASVCQHCGGPLTPGEGAPAASAPRRQHVRGPCPKCDHGRFVVIAPFATPHPEDHDALVCVPVLTAIVAGRRVEVGSFRACVCAQCGYTEWYAADLAALVGLAGRAPSVELVDADGGAPYR